MNRITLERTFRATPAEIWALWTTKDGIESWWGPEGFSVAVKTLDLRPGGGLAYDMIATAAPQIAFMQRAGMPLRQPTQLRYTEVEPLRRLAWLHAVDFVPGVPTYETASELVLHPTGDHVHLVLTFDPMHDPAWTERQQAGWESELDRLGKLLAARTS
jgi:uncharacterized protein YndB with AHSA1/START domain